MTPYPITSFMIGGRRRDQATFLLLFGEFRTMLFPRIPSLIDSSAEGIWTEELMLKARTCFEVEAANVEMAVCMPEVFAHEELKADERFRVEVGGKVVGAKMCCPGCKSNKYVLMGGLNVHSIDKVRFAHGNNKMIMPISSEYICFNAECHDVIDKHISASDKLATLRSYKEQGITATNAKQHKKVTELTKLGVSFHGHDTRVMMMLPRKVRAMYKGLIFWGEQGGCDDEFAEKILKASMNLAELEADLATTSKAHQRASMQAYHAFSRAPPSRLAAAAPPPVPERMWICFSEACNEAEHPSTMFSKNGSASTRPPTASSAIAANWPRTTCCIGDEFLQSASDIDVGGSRTFSPCRLKTDERLGSHFSGEEIHTLWF